MTWWWLLASGLIALVATFSSTSAQRFGASLRGQTADQPEGKEEPRWRDMSNGQRIFIVVAALLFIGACYLRFRRLN